MIQDARAYCHVFFPWYNAEHHHVGVGLLTPGDGLAEQRVAAVLATAYAAHPERFPGGLRLDQGDFAGAVAPRQVPLLLHDIAWALGAAYWTGRRAEGVALMEDAARGFAERNVSTRGGPAASGRSAGRTS